MGAREATEERGDRIEGESSSGTGARRRKSKGRNDTIKEEWRGRINATEARSKRGDDAIEGKSR